MGLISIVNLLFKKKLKEYVTFNFSNCTLNDFRVYTLIDGKQLELTGKESPICLDPVQVCIIEDVILPEKITIFYSYKDNVIASVNGVKRTLRPVQVYQLENVSFTKHSLLYNTIYYLRINSGKSRNSFKKYLNLISTFFYPRKVILVSVFCEGFVSIFPMDFQMVNVQKSIVVLGLRRTNKTNDFIGNKNLKISIADFSEENKEDAYAFGKFHTNNFPDPKNLPYRFIETKIHQNIFPDFILGYTELELLQYEIVGSHGLFICRIINTSDLKNSKSNPLYHLHYLATHE